MSRYIRNGQNVKSGNGNINNERVDNLNQPQWWGSGYRERRDTEKIKIKELRHSLKSISETNTAIDNETNNINSEYETIAQRNRGFGKLTSYQKKESKAMKNENAKNRPLGNERSYTGLYDAGYRRVNQEKDKKMKKYISETAKFDKDYI
jgi:hypothetical protein